jgi:hypothetical protein
MKDRINYHKQLVEILSENQIDLDMLLEFFTEAIDANQAFLELIPMQHPDYLNKKHGMLNNFRKIHLFLREIKRMYPHLTKDTQVVGTDRRKAVLTNADKFMELLKR